MDNIIHIIPQKYCIYWKRNSLHPWTKTKHTDRQQFLPFRETHHAPHTAARRSSLFEYWQKKNVVVHVRPHLENCCHCLVIFLCVCVCVFQCLSHTIINCNCCHCCLVVVASYIPKEPKNWKVDPTDWGRGQQNSMSVYNLVVVAVWRTWNHVHIIHISFLSYIYVGFHILKWLLVAGYCCAVCIISGGWHETINNRQRSRTLEILLAFKGCGRAVGELDVGWGMGLLPATSEVLLFCPHPFLQIYKL